MKIKKKDKEDKFCFTQEPKKSVINNPFIRTESESMQKSEIHPETPFPEKNKSKTFKKSKNQSSKQKNSLSLQKSALFLKIEGFHSTERITIFAEHKQKKTKIKKKLEVTTLNGERVEQGLQLSTLINQFDWFSLTHWMVKEESLFVNSYNSIKNSFLRFFPNLTCGIDNDGFGHLGLKANLLEYDLAGGDTWLIWVLGLEKGKLRLVFVRKQSIANKILRETGESTSVTVRRRFVQFISEPNPLYKYELKEIKEEIKKKASHPSFENKSFPNYFFHNDVDSKKSQKGIEILKQEMIQGIEGIQYWKRYDCRIQNDNMSSISKNLTQEHFYAFETQKKEAVKSKSEIQDEPNESRRSDWQDQFTIDLDIPCEIFSEIFTPYDIQDQTQKSLDENRSLPQVFTWKTNCIDCYQDLKTKEVYSKKQFESKLKRYRNQFDNQRRESRVNDLHKSTVITRTRTEPIDSFKMPFERKNTEGARENNRQSFEDVSTRLRKKDSDFRNFLLKKGIYHFGLKSVVEWIGRVLQKYKEASEEQNFNPNFKIATSSLSEKLEETTLVVRSNDSVYICSQDSATNLKINPSFVKIHKFISQEIFKKSGFCHDFIMNLVLKRTKSIKLGKPKSFDLPQMKKGFNEFLYIYDRTIKAFELNKWYDLIKRKKKSIFKKEERQKLVDTSINQDMAKLPGVSMMLGHSIMQCTLESNDYNPGQFKGHYRTMGVVQEESETEDESITFTLREIIIEFSKEEFITSTGTVPESASNSKNTKKCDTKHRYKFFVVSVPDFENSEKSDKLVLIADLENFNIGNCNHKCQSNRENLSFLANSKMGKFGVNFAQHEKEKIKMSSQVVIDEKEERTKPITVESSRHVVWRNSSQQKTSKTSLAKDISPFSKNSEKKEKIGSGVSIAKNIGVMKTPDPDSGLNRFQYKPRLTMKSDLSPPFTNDNGPFLSSRKISKLDWRTSIMRTQRTETAICNCSKSIEDAEFFKLLRSSINNNTFSALLYVLVKSNIVLFKLDSTLFS